MKKLIIIFGMAILATACNWVEVTEEGKAIRIASMDDVKDCKRVGKVFAQLKDQIAGFDRNESTVKREIETLARNTAAASDLDGDTIVPITTIKGGKQTFAVYKCIRPALKKEAGE